MNQRPSNLSTAAPWFSLMVIAALAFATVLQAAPSRQNVIVILTDDQGSVDAGCYGAKDLVTPHIDALAARGVRFTQFDLGTRLYANLEAVRDA